MKILVVEDSNNQLQEIQKMLQQAGYRVQAAEDETQAIEGPLKPGTLGGLVAILERGEEIIGTAKARDKTVEPEGMGFIREVAAMVAHEIRNPLQKIVMNTYLLERAINLDENNSKYMKKINDSVFDLSTIVNDMLTFNHKVNLFCQPVDVSRLLEDVLSETQDQIEKHAIEIVREYEGALPLATLDPFKIKQVFTNLITNALQAMSAGGALTLRTRWLTSRNLLEVAFRDTGMGISEDHLEQIFEPFFTTRRGGIGLGLSVVCQLVKAHGGQIQVESQAGQGSEFRLLFPVCANPRAG